MAGCGRFGGCHKRRARAFHSFRAHITSASCTKSSLNTPNEKRPDDPPHRDAFVFCRAQPMAAPSEFREKKRRVRLSFFSHSVCGLELYPHAKLNPAATRIPVGRDELVRHNAEVLRVGQV